MIDESAAHELLENHIYWYENGPHKEVERHRDTYRDRFWAKDDTAKGRQTWDVQGTSVSTSGGSPDENPNADIFPTQTNLLRPWAISYHSSLYYDGIQVEVVADEVEDAPEEDRIKVAAGIRELLNRLAETSQMEDASERVFTMGLLYPGGAAFKLCARPKDERLKGQSAVDLIDVQAIPPWELTYDRKARDEKQMRYRGHLRQEPIEKARQLWDIADDEKGVPLRDVPAHGLRSHHQREHDDESYVWIWDLDDLTDTTETDGGRLVGKRATYLVRNMGEGASVIELASGATPYSWYDGFPLWEAVLFICEPLIERGIDSLAPASTVYELNAELNRAQSILAGQFRRDVAQPILVDDSVDEEALKKLQSNRDREAIPWRRKGNMPMEMSIFVPNFEPRAGTMREYRDVLWDGLDRSTILMSQTQGKAGQYLKAEEVTTLRDYTESTIGRFRKRSDRALARLFAGYLRMLATTMEDVGEGSIDVVVDGEAIAITPEDLRRRWDIRIVDTASSRKEKAQKLADFQAAQPTMMENLALAYPPDPQTGHPSSAMQSFAKHSHDFYVDALGLPEHFKTSALEAAPPVTDPPVPPEPEPVATTSPAPQEGQLSPEEAAMLAESPAAQAIVETAEAGL